MTRKSARRKQRELEAKRNQVGLEVEAALGNSVICQRCGTTLANFSDWCEADLLDRCEGFEAIERVRQPIVTRIYGL
jgi:hypothetical protein